MATTDLTAATFDATIRDNDIVLLDFWADWCGPCRMFAPVYEQVSEEHPDIVFGKIDTEAEQSLAAAFGIRSIPTLMIFREEVIIFAQPGALVRSQLEQLIEGARNLDMAEVRAELARREAQTETA